MKNGFFVSFIIVLLVMQSAWLVPAVRASSNILFVAPTAQGSGDCSSWANACTLQTALQNAVSGDEIWVQAGVYYPGTSRSASFVLKNGVALYGGFTGTESQRSERDWASHLTILSGDIDQNDINNDGNFIAETWEDVQGNNVYHVVTGTNLDANTVLDGFVITAGLADTASFSNHLGGAIYLTSSSPRLVNLQISGNLAIAGGGLAMLAGSAPQLLNVTFQGNRATSGGAIYTYESTPQIETAVFRENSSVGDGGGVYSVLSQVTILQGQFQRNVASYSGGAIFSLESELTLRSLLYQENTSNVGGAIASYDSTLTVLSNAFIGNQASDGGGIYSNNSTLLAVNTLLTGNLAFYRGGGLSNLESNVTLINTTVGNNTASSSLGGGIYNLGTNNIIITNVVAWGNTPNNIFNLNSSPLISYSNIGDCGAPDQWDSACGTDMGGNLDVDPLFLDLSGGNLRLSSFSPMVDAGNNAALPAEIVQDLDGNPRFVDIPTTADTGHGTPPLVDIGAYEVQDTVPPVVTAIQRAEANPTGKALVQFTVIFSEPVNGVDVTDFSLATTGAITGAAVVNVDGTGSQRTVTVNTGSGNGTLRLDLNATATGIVDMSGNVLTQGFTDGEEYTIFKFGKAAPLPNATNEPTTVTLSWQALPEATGYEYCYSSAPNACTRWNAVGQNTSVTLQVAPNYAYYWQVRAVTTSGSVEADGETWWTFTTQNVPTYPWPTYTPPSAATFLDVPMSSGYWNWVERLVNAGITRGCGGQKYCPSTPVTRAQMAIFLLRSRYGSTYTPPAITSSLFNDVPVSSFYAPWIVKLASDGITAGCAPELYCPNQAVTRAQMAVFILRSRHGPTYSPPRITSSPFVDVPVTSGFAPWIVQLANEGITAGCQPQAYCPNASVTRAQMAVFLVRAFINPYDLP